jgi:hypothetical protein
VSLAETYWDDNAQSQYRLFDFFLHIAIYSLQANDGAVCGCMYANFLFHESDSMV